MIKFICDSGLRIAVKERVRQVFVEVYSAGYPGIEKDPAFDEVFDRDICQIEIVEDGVVAYAEENLSIDLLSDYWNGGLRPGWDEEKEDIDESILPALQSIKDAFPEIKINGFFTFYDEYEPLGCVYFTNDKDMTVYRKPANYCAQCNDGPLTDEEMEQFHILYDMDEVYFCSQDCLDDFKDDQGLD